MSKRDWDEIRNKTTIPWADFSREEFVKFYWKVIAPILDEEGYDPETTVPATVLRELGFGRYIQGIRRHYDYSIKEFLIEEAGVTDPECPHEYNWPIEDKETKEWLDNFVKDLRKRDSKKEKESTICRISMNIYSFLQEWGAAHESTNIVETLKESSEEEAYQLTLAVYDRLNERVESENTKCRYVTDHGYFFEYLTKPGNPLEYNPVPEVANRFKWEREDIDPFERSALSSDQVKRLWRHADTPEEQMIVIAACAWGLRTGEIASLHISQLRLDEDPNGYDGPVVTFDVRKNGPSTVPIIYGKEIAKNRIKELEEKYGDGWNGYLFPSEDRRAEHLKNKAIKEDRFESLAERAGITINEDLPTLKEARRFWYQLHLEGIHEYNELVTKIAERQGSKDADVVIENYLGVQDQVRFARTWMHRQLDEAFGDLEINKEPLNNEKDIEDIMRDMVSEFPKFFKDIFDSDSEESVSDD